MRNWKRGFGGAASKKNETAEPDQHKINRAISDFIRAEKIGNLEKLPLARGVARGWGPGGPTPPPPPNREIYNNSEEKGEKLRKIEKKPRKIKKKWR